MQRRKNPPTQEFQQRQAGGFLDDKPGDRVIRVAVLPLRAWVEIERDARPAVEDLLRSCRLQHHRRDIILRPEILVPGGHRKQLSDCNLASARQVGHEPRYRIVERKFALLREHKNCNCSELLADRTDAVTHFRARRRLGFQIGEAVRFCIHDPVVSDYGERSTGRARTRQRLRGDFIYFFLHIGRNPRLGLRKRLQAYCHCQDDKTRRERKRVSRTHRGPRNL